jgi:colanic acid biosynthesis glycosyl transferase WcaI
MHLVTLDWGGYSYPSQLSRELARRGNRVEHVYAPEANPTAPQALTPRPDDPETLAFVPLSIGREFGRYSVLRRPVDEYAFGRVVVRHLRRRRPDVVLSANTPLLSQLVVQSWARSVGTKFVFWVQDLLSLGMRDELRRRLGAPGRPLGEVAVALENRLLRRSDHLVAITPDFWDIFESVGVREDGFTVIENWAPLEDVPTSPRHNPWSAAHGLDDAFVFLYAGTLGIKHDPSMLAALAEMFRDDDHVRIVVAGRGPGAEWLEARRGERGLQNLLLLPFQPYDVLPQVLGSADVLVGMLEREAGIFSVPSKILTYHCAARPILAAVPSENLSARMIENVGSGLVVEPGDEAAFKKAARRLLEDAELRGDLSRRARAYAEATFDISAITDKFELVLKEAVGGWT